MSATTTPVRPRVLMVAYACRPGEGSEPGMGWNRAVQAAKSFDTWVLCDGSRNRAAIEAYLQQQGEVPGLKFLFVGKSTRQRILEKLPGGFYPAYNAWHYAAYQAAMEWHREIGFDLVHQVSYCGYREPGYCWKLPVPFIWGPIGGTHNFPWRFLPGAGVRGAVADATRSLANTLQFRFSPRIAQALRAARVTFAGNSTTQKHFAEYYHTKLPLMPANGIHNVTASPRLHRGGGKLRLLWSGRLHPLKGLPLVLRALAQMPGHVPFELRVLGDGPARARHVALAEKLGIGSSIDWKGWVPHHEVNDHYRWADAFVFTSMRDTMPGVVIESLAAGTPVVTLDHLGMADIVDETCGLKIPVVSPQQIARDLQEAIVRLTSDADQWERLSRGAIARAERYTWSYQAVELDQWYRKVLGIAPASIASDVLSAHPTDCETTVTA